MNLIRKNFTRLMIVKRIRKYVMRIDIINVRLAFEEAEGYAKDSLISAIKKQALKRDKELLQRAINRLFKLYIKHI